MKICSRCRKELPAESFYKRSATSDVLKLECKSCSRARLSAWAKANPERKRRLSSAWAKANPARTKAIKLKHTLAKYGLTPETYGYLLTQQGGVCAICRTDVPGGNSDRLYVDHDHSTQEVRGLLCHYCNVALGYMRDSPQICRQAAEYLAGYKQCQHSLTSPTAPISLRKRKVLTAAT